MPKHVDAYEKQMKKNLKKAELLPDQYATQAARPIRVYKVLGEELPSLHYRLKTLEDWKDNVFKAAPAKKTGQKRSGVSHGASSGF